MRLLALICLVITLVSNISFAQTVTVAGSGSDKGSAMCNIAENVEGTFLDSKAFVSSTVVPLHEVYAKPQGVVKTSYAELNDHPNVGLLEFTNKAAVSSDISFEDARMVSDYMIEELLDSGRFNVMEREQLKGILDQYSINMSGLVDPSTAVQIGKLTGVDFLVYGSITGLSTKNSEMGISETRTGGISNQQNVVTANIAVRFIDLKTGRIVLSSLGVGSSTSSNTEFVFRHRSGHYHRDGSVIRIGSDSVSQVQVHNALAKSVTNAVYGKNGILAKMDGRAKRKYK